MDYTQPVHGCGCEKTRLEGVGILGKRVGESGWATPQREINRDNHSTRCLVNVFASPKRRVDLLNDLICRLRGLVWDLSRRMDSWYLHEILNQTASYNVLTLSTEPGVDKGVCTCNIGCRESLWIFRQKWRYDID